MIEVASGCERSMCNRAIVQEVCHHPSVELSIDEVTIDSEF